jgi:glycosyltransferase involved in cell wall biosynthesis
MKIALVDPSLFTLPYDQELAGGLQDAGHQVWLYGKVPSAAEAQSTPAYLRPLFYGALATGIWDKLPKPLFRAAKGVSHIAGMRRFCAEMERLQPDVIHFQWLPLPVVDSWFLRRLRRVAPLVITVHDTMPFNGAPGSSLQSIGAFDALRHFDALIVHTENGRQIVANHLGQADRVRCIPHGLLHQGDLTDEGQAPACAPETPTTFLLFGKIKPYKGLDVLIRALAELDPAMRAKCRVHVVGKAYMDMRPLEELAAQTGVANRIDFDLRFVSSVELNRIFRSADVLVFPYRQIEASGVLMTAMVVGKPVIATRMGAAAELFGDGKGGFLIPPDDPAALAQAMRSFIERPELVVSCAAHVRQLRDAIPSWADIGRLTTAAYEGAYGHWRASGSSPRAHALAAPQPVKPGASGPG